MENLRQKVTFNLIIGAIFKSTLKSTCGYYGWTGKNIIFREVAIMFPEKELKITDPINYIDYLEFVLVPETALCLIADDFNYILDENYDTVLQLYHDSIEFGELVNGETEIDAAESDADSQSIDFSNSDSDTDFDSFDINTAPTNAENGSTQDDYENDSNNHADPNSGLLIGDFSSDPYDAPNVDSPSYASESSYGDSEVCSDDNEHLGGLGTFFPSLESMMNLCLLNGTTTEDSQTDYCNLSELSKRFSEDNDTNGIPALQGFRVVNGQKQIIKLRIGI